MHLLFLIVIKHTDTHFEMQGGHTTALGNTLLSVKASFPQTPSVSLFVTWEALLCRLGLMPVEMCFPGQDEDLVYALRKRPRDLSPCSDFDTSKCFFH